MLKKYNKLISGLAFIYLAVFVTNINAQVVSPYKTFSVLRNHTISYDAVSTNGGIQIKKQVHNGSISAPRISNNTYRITYTPNSNFIGNDTLIYEYWNFINPSTMAPFTEHVIFQVKPIIFSDDYITITTDSTDVEIDVLANDLSDGSIEINTITLQSNIQASISNNKIIINPVNAGNGYVKYIICDNGNNCVSGILNIKIEETFTPDTLFKTEFTLRGIPFKTYLGDGTFDIMLNPAHGNIQVSDGVLQFSPNASYTGSDQLILERSFQGENQIIHLNIQILPYTTPFRMVKHDRFYTSRNDVLSINVLDNDLVNNKPIQSYTQAQNGTLTYLGSGEFIYTPNYNFSGTDYFTYRVCALSNINCEVARVDIVVDNFIPENGIYHFQTSKDQPFIFRYPAPISSFDWEIIENAFHGNLTYYPGQQTFNISGQDVSGFNLIAYQPPVGFTGTDQMRIQYCAGGACKSVKIYMNVLDSNQSDCVVECVWPGDANVDGEVNVYDILPIAYFHGISGSSRPSAPGELYLSYPSDDWGQMQSNNIDIKHIDTDGDGSIAVDDINIIDEFYSFDNQIKPITANPLLEVPIILDLITPEVEIGETAIFNIIVGTAQYPAIDFQGLGLQLNLGNATFFDTSTLSLTLYDDSWISNAGPSINFTNKQNGFLLDGAIARIDHQFKSGFGIIGKFEGTIVRDIGGFHIGGGDYLKIPLSITSNQVLGQDGHLYTMPAFNTELRVKIGSKSKYASSGVRVYPNPANDYVVFSALNEDQRLTSLQLYTLSGNLIHQEQFGSLETATVDISTFQNGVYLAKIMTNNGVHTSKIIIQK
jgi:hypothetical protein